MSDDWRNNLVENDDDLRALFTGARTIAVVGMKSGVEEVSFRIPEYMQRQGFRILPVNPKLDVALGQKANTDLLTVEPPIDIVNVFRASNNIPDHTDEALALRPLPGVFWMQLGIRHDACAERLARAGVKVVQDRCLMVEHQRLLGGN